MTFSILVKMDSGDGRWLAENRGATYCIILEMRHDPIIEEFTQAKLKVAQKHGKKLAEWVPEKVNFLVSNR